MSWIASHTHAPPCQTRTHTSHSTHCCQSEAGNKQHRASVFKQRFPLCKWMRWSRLPALKHSISAQEGADVSVCWTTVKKLSCSNNISHVREGIFFCSFYHFFLLNENWYRCLLSKQKHVKGMLALGSWDFRPVYGLIENHSDVAAGKVICEMGSA